MKSHDPKVAGREKYEQMWDVTAAVVRAWDPYRLLAGGAPVDELDGEIASLVAQIPRITSATDAAHAVSRIFGSSLEPSVFTPQSCEDIGEKLFTALKKRGLK
jgi:Domain of unknown function (DUF1871)